MNTKKLIRANFRREVFERDHYCCVMCGFRSSPEEVENDLDAHHITDRSLMPHGGYVKENGASVCDMCHELAEEYHRTGTAVPGYSPDDLYRKIASSYEEAVTASENLRVVG